MPMVTVNAVCKVEIIERERSLTYNWNFDLVDIAPRYLKD